MDHELMALLTTAASVGVVHTLLGPDHYLPFVAMSRAGSWSLRKTLLITSLCGLGHVLSSVVIGVIGLGIGAAVLRSDRIGFLTELEGARGELAGWMLIALGAIYLVWGVRQSIRNRPHAHLHAHADGTVHVHEHTHGGGHLHPHETELHPSAGVASLDRIKPRAAVEGAMGKLVCLCDREAEHEQAVACPPPQPEDCRGTCSPLKKSNQAVWHRFSTGENTAHKPVPHDLQRAPWLTPWVLFTIFLFGPCETLIPVLMLPAALHGGIAAVAIVTAVFAAATIATMTFIVATGYFGLSAPIFGRVERHAQAIAGGMVVICGIAVKAGL